MQQSQKTLEFLQKLKDSGHWNDDYDYSEVEYINKRNKVVIVNKKYKTKHLITPLSALSGIVEKTFYQKKSQTKYMHLIT